MSIDNTGYNKRDVGPQILDKGRLRSFLDDVDCGKFAYWPNLQVESVREYLLEDISQIATTGVLFETIMKGETQALLVAKPLIWDSTHFGFKCISVRYLFGKQSAETQPNRQALAQVVSNFQEYCADSGIEFVSVDIDSRDCDASYVIQDAGYKYVLSWIDGFVRQPVGCEHDLENMKIGALHVDELPHFESMCAEQYFEGGRFYMDHRFDRNKVDQMYANLVRSSFENNDIMLVCRIDGLAIALLISKKIAAAGLLGGKKIAHLRFLILAREWRGANVARVFFARAVRHLLESCELVTTGLEVHNLASLNLHCRTGFKFNYVHSVYHWWRPSA